MLFLPLFALKICSNFTTHSTSPAVQFHSDEGKKLNVLIHNLQQHDDKRKINDDFFTMLKFSIPNKLCSPDSFSVCFEDDEKSIVGQYT